jgi:transposase
MSSPKSYVAIRTFAGTNPRKPREWSIKPGAVEETTPFATAEPPCPCCGGRMRIVETIVRGQTPRTWPTFRSRIDTS